jgi:hypothetical protein
VLTAFAAGRFCSAVGLYGVPHRRRAARGIGVLALAPAHCVLGMVVKRGVLLIRLGLLLGFAGAWGGVCCNRCAERCLRSRDVHDRAGRLAAMSLVACYLPARRAAVVIDPLKSE